MCLLDVGLPSCQQALDQQVCVINNTRTWNMTNGHNCICRKTVNIFNNVSIKQTQWLLMCECATDLLYVPQNWYQLSDLQNQKPAHLHTIWNNTRMWYHKYKWFYPNKLYLNWLSKLLFYFVHICTAYRLWFILAHLTRDIILHFWHWICQLRLPLQTLS